MYLRTYTLILVVFLISSHTIAFQPTKFDHIKNTDGLSNNSVTSIVKDGKGYMWFGTYNGLNKYDGLRIKSYGKESDDTGLPDIHITYLFSDSEGVLWVGTRNGGLVKYNQKSDNFSKINLLGNQENPSMEIRAIAEDSNKNLWIGTISNGLFCVDYTGNIISHFSTSKSSSLQLISNNITSLYFDKIDKKLIIGSKSPFLESFEVNNIDSSYSKYPLISLDKPIYPKKIVQDNDDNIWVATYKNGLFRIDKSTKNIRRWDTENSNLDHNVIFNLSFRPEENSLWIATDGRGIQNYDIATDSFSSIVNSADPESLSSDSVLCFFKDELNNMWIGTQYGGINISNALFRQYNPMNSFNGLTNNRVKCFLEYSKELIFIGTDGGGLSVHDRKDNSVGGVNLGNYKNLHINSLFKKRDGSILIGTYGHGLLEYNPNNSRTKNLIKEWTFGNNDAGRFIQDAIEFNDLIIFGTPYGLYSINKKNQIEKILLNNPDALLDSYQLNSIKCLAIQNNRVWVGTKAGFTSLDVEGEDFKLNYYKVVGKNQGLTPQSENIINRIEVQANRILLCSDKGLKVFYPEDERITEIGSSEMLNNSMILDVIADEMGGFWICTDDKGLLKFTEEDEVIKLFNVENGLRDNSLNAILLTSDMKIFTGGNNGYNHFFPGNITKKIVDTKIHFTDFKLFNESVGFKNEGDFLKWHISYYDNLTLKSDQNDISFDFIALNYDAPRSNRYAYFLENYDQSWKHIGNSTTATYTHLPPGDYTLKVKATNSAGDLATRELTMGIKVLPPWYKTVWAYISYVILLGTLLFIFYKVSLKWAGLNHKLEIETLEREKKEALIKTRAEFFTNISHEFKTPLSLILAPIDIMLKKGSGTMEDFGLIKQNANRLLRLVNQIMDLRRSETGNLKLHLEEFEINGFMQEIIQSFQVLSESRNISLLYYPCEPTVLKQDKYKLDKIFFNLLSNAFKACGKGDSITVSTNIMDCAKGPCLEIIVEDTGKGIAKENLERIFDRYYHIEQNPGSTGVGLSLTKTYINFLEGEIKVVSKKGVGTYFTVSLPIEKGGDFSFLSVVQNKNFVAEPHFEEVKNSKEMQIKSKKILIIEDEVEIGNFLQRALGEDYIISRAMDGEEGFNDILQYWPDLVISDVMMPNMSGFELCEKMKSDIRTSHIPIILLTAMGSEEKLIEGSQLGADLYVSKPFSIELLKTQLKTLFDNINRRRETYQRKLSVEDGESVGKSKKDPFVAKATSIVLENLSDTEFSVERFSDELAMHRTNLHHKLKTLTGLSPSEFMRGVRLSQSIEYLVNNTDELNISQIAYSVGFNTPAYFTKCFKRQYGCLPGEFKKHMQI